MQIELEAFVERYCFRPRVKEYRPHAAGASLVVCEVDKRAARARVPARLINDQIVDVQMRSASQSMYRPHPHHTNNALSVKSCDKLISGEGLTLHPPQKLVLCKVAKLGNNREGQMPFSGRQASNGQRNHEALDL